MSCLVVLKGVIEVGLVRDLILFRGSYKDNPFLGIPFVSSHPHPLHPRLSFSLVGECIFSIIVSTPTRQLPF